MAVAKRSLVIAMVHMQRLADTFKSEKLRREREGLDLATYVKAQLQIWQRRQSSKSSNRAMFSSGDVYYMTRLF